ncbi:MAG: hypothetical protein AAF224_01145 [Pseudomonadota bacterium]
MALRQLDALLDPEEALCAQSFLSANGIPTIIANAHHLAADPLLRVALGGHRLCVSESDLDRARDVIADRLAAASIAEEDDPEQSDEPSKQRPLRALFAMGTVFMFGTPLWWRVRKYRHDPEIND